jgi:hypothetical protein
VIDAAGSAISQEHINRAVLDAIDKGLIRRRLLAGDEYPPDVQVRVYRALDAYDTRNQ